MNTILDCPTAIEPGCAEASLVIVHHVAPELVSRFVELLEDFTSAGEQRLAT